MSHQCHKNITWPFASLLSVAISLSHSEGPGGPVLTGRSYFLLQQPMVPHSMLLDGLSVAGVKVV